MSLVRDMRRLVRHSMIYGVGGLISRVVAVILLPIYTRYVQTSGYGAFGNLVAAETVAVILLRLGIQSAFFRFYFDSPEPARRATVVRTSFWFTMGMATLGLVLGQALAPQISVLLFGNAAHETLVRAMSVTLWADMNYGQMTSLFRVEERSLAFLVASVCNITITIGATVTLVVALHKGALGLIVGNVTGTLSVYFVLLAYRRYQLGLEFDRSLFREMNRFGMPLVPSALALWINQSVGVFFVTRYKGVAENGLYTAGTRIASAMILLIGAFQLAWPAFAYSIEDDARAKRTYAYVLTYVMFLTSWAALALSALTPWIVRLLASSYYRSERVVPWLAFTSVAFAGYMVTVIGVGRVRKTRSNWIVTGTAAAIMIGLSFVFVPRWGIVGAGAASLVAYAFMFAGMTLRANRLFPVPYQWLRVGLVLAVAGAESVLTRTLHSLALSILLVATYPLLLGVLGFYQPAERARLTALLRRRPVTG